MHLNWIWGQKRDLKTWIRTYAPSFHIPNNAKCKIYENSILAYDCFLQIRFNKIICNPIHVLIDSCKRGTDLSLIFRKELAV